MNKTYFKNNYDKFFKQIIDSDVVSFRTNKIDTLELSLNKNNRKNLITIRSEIHMNEENILEFSYIFNKEKTNKSLDNVYESIKTINEISLYQAQDEFCKEQALELRYNENKYFYILIYTDMVESSLEFFDEKMSAEKFKKVAF